MAEATPTGCCCHTKPPCYSDSLEPPARERLWLNCHHRYVTDRVSGLLELGVTQDDIDQMLVRNPARLFSERTPY